MQKVTYTNARGESLSFAYDPPFLLSRIEGLGDVQADVQSQKAPYQDGSTHVDTVLEPRYIPITFTLKGNNYAEIADLRRLVSKVFNPKLGLGKLKYEVDNTVREIYAVCDGSPFFPSGDSRGTTHQVGTIDLLAPNPYWRDPQQVSRSLRAYEGKFTFPFTFPVQFGIEGDITTITNEGDTSTPVIITIQGPIRRPMIENRTTGDFIRVNTTIGPGEVLYIDTNPQAKRVEIHRQNQIIKAMGYFDHNADFWQLEVGENELRYTADEGIAEAIAAIGYHAQYVGI